MIVTTTENITGMRVTRVIGQMFGLTVRTRGVGGNIAAQFRGLAGGEVKSYTKLLEDARREAVDRLVASATAAGANAVVMMRFDSSEMGQTMSEIVAYGTAVVAEPLPPSS
ncbi:MAG: heavy metal-binding domain-containing protein [Candidatus Dormibacteraeota bacterium]|nr:heavy metal-binding domain-containing protein [Candidatus Dormibacteraeota bacterium]